MKKILVIIVAALLLPAMPTKAACKFDVGANLVSSYVWRGSYYAGASFQPSMNLTAGGFCVGAWGSTDFTLGHKEVDLNIGYSFGDFYIGLTDYWWGGEGAFNYFQIGKKNNNSHLLEVNLNYAADFGLHVSLNTFVAGSQDKYDGNDLKRAFTSYFEAGYSFSVKDVNLTASIGVSPWNKTGLYVGGGKYPYATDDFAVTNVSLKAAKKIAITDKFSLPIFGQISWNPAIEDVFLVFGLKF